MLKTSQRFIITIVKRSNNTHNDKLDSGDKAIYKKTRGKKSDKDIKAKIIKNSNNFLNLNA